MKNVRLILQHKTSMTLLTIPLAPGSLRAVECIKVFAGMSSCRPSSAATLSSHGDQIGIKQLSVLHTFLQAVLGLKHLHLQIKGCEANAMLQLQHFKRLALQLLPCRPRTHAWSWHLTMTLYLIRTSALTMCWQRCTTSQLLQSMSGGLRFLHC